MKRFLAALLAITVVMVPSSLVAQATGVVDSIRPLQMVHEGKLRNVCTVSSINETTRTWLTAAHCVSDGSVVPYYIAGEQVAYVGYDEKNDIVFLRTLYATAPALKLSMTPPELGDRVALGGFPWGIIFPLFITGQISSTAINFEASDGSWSKDYMAVQAVGAPGNSGSPIVNAAGEIIAILQAGPGGLSYGQFQPLFFSSTWDQLMQYAEMWE